MATDRQIFTSAVLMTISRAALIISVITTGQIYGLIKTPADHPLLGLLSALNIGLIWTVICVRERPVIRNAEAGDDVPN